MFVIIFTAMSWILASAALVLAQPEQVKVAVLTPGLSLQPVLDGLQEGLARLGYIKDKNISFLVEDTKGNSADTADLLARAAKLLSAKPDVLVAVSTAHAQAAKQATTTVPVVFAWVGDPVQAGLIARYPYSKTNLTGVAAIGDALTGKRLELLLEIAPKVNRLFTLVSAKESIARSSFRTLAEAAKKFRVKLIHHEVTSEEEVNKALEETPKSAMDAIFHVPSTLVRTHLDLLVKRAKKDRIPFAVHEDALVERGALMSYGPNTRLIGIQSAALVLKALKGTKPGEIMVENPEKFVLVINRGTAKEIGLSIPSRILERADRLVD